MRTTSRLLRDVGCAAVVACAVASARANGQAVPPDSALASATLRSACGSDAAARGVGLVTGEVRDAEAHPIPDAAVTISWSRPVAQQAVGSRASVPTDAAALGVLSDDRGRWRICGAPLGAALSIRAAADEGSADRTATLDAGHPLAALDFTLGADPGAGTLTPAARTAVVVFSVDDGAGHALGGVTLDLVPADGPEREVMTDSAGRAIVPSVAPGRARVRSRGIGFRPGELVVPLEAGRNTVPLTLDAVHIPTLATIRVIGDREVLPRHEEFEARRAFHQTTASITAADIEKRNPVDTWQMLTNVPAMRVMEIGSGVYAMSTREQPVVQRRDAQGGATTVPCWYRVMIDGMIMPDPTPDLSTLLPVPSEIHGIEVFAGLATIPPKYSGAVLDQGQARANTCGLIAVWTK